MITGAHLQELDHGGCHFRVSSLAVQQLLLQVDGLPQLCGAPSQQAMQTQQPGYGRLLTLQCNTQ